MIVPSLFIERFKKQLKPACEVDGVLQSSVLQAMLSVPRHLFVDAAMQHRAYQNNALPIGYAQTISQPTVVASMTAHLFHALEHSLGCFNNVLEIGTGSGYQSAILAKLWKKVYTIERVESLHRGVALKHQQIKIDNVDYHYADGHLGLEQCAPFEAIILTACCTDIPTALQQQLAINGAIIAPVEYEDTQALMLYQKKQLPTGIEWQENLICEVKFVPMLGGLRDQ